MSKLILPIRLTKAKLGVNNDIATRLKGKSPDGRSRYSLETHLEIYSRLLQIIRDTRPKLSVSLCLETIEAFDRLNLRNTLGKCNCVL